MRRSIHDSVSEPLQAPSDRRDLDALYEESGAVMNFIVQTAVLLFENGDVLFIILPLLLRVILRNEEKGEVSVRREKMKHHGAMFFL